MGRGGGNVADKRLEMERGFAILRSNEAVRRLAVRSRETDTVGWVSGRERMSRVV